MAAIRKECERRGWFVFKVHGSAFQMPGLPDLVVCAEGRFLGIEVKRPGGKPTAVQDAVHAAIRRAGGQVIVATGAEDLP